MAATDLRERIRDDELLVLPDVYDALSATIAADVGFEAATMGGLATGATLGEPEPVLSMAEMRDRARAVTGAVDLSLVIDGATGFGRRAHVERTVREFAAADVAGVFIEDQVPPRRMTHAGAPLELVATEEMEAKLAAAADARAESEDDIVILAKTQVATGDRREFESIEDVVARMNRYLEAGADAGCVYPRTEAEARYVAEHVDGPLKFAVVPGKEFCPDFETVEAMGYAMANTPNVGTLAAAKRVREFYETLAEDGSIDADDTLAEKTRVKDLLFDRYR